MAGEFNIVPELSFICGNPPDARDDILRTIRFIRRIKRINPDTEIIIYRYDPVPFAGAMWNAAAASGYQPPDTLEALGRRTVGSSAPAAAGGSAMDFRRGSTVTEKFRNRAERAVSHIDSTAPVEFSRPDTAAPGQLVALQVVMLPVAGGTPPVTAENPVPAAGNIGILIMSTSRGPTSIFKWLQSAVARLFFRLRFLLVHQRRMNQPVIETIAGVPILVLPGIMNPRIFLTGSFFCRCLKQDGSDSAGKHRFGSGHRVRMLRRAGGPGWRASDCRRPSTRKLCAVPCLTGKYTAFSITWRFAAAICFQASRISGLTLFYSIRRSSRAIPAPGLSNPGFSRTCPAGLPVNWQIIYVPADLPCCCCLPPDSARRTSPNWHCKAMASIRSKHGICGVNP